MTSTIGKCFSFNVTTERFSRKGGGSDKGINQPYAMTPLILILNVPTLISDSLRDGDNLCVVKNGLEAHVSD